MFFIVAAVVLIVGQASPEAIVAGAALWGITFGGASAQLQAALTRAGRENADVANSFLPVAFNLAIFAAGITGALLLGHFGSVVLAALMAALGVLAFLLNIFGRRTAFPATH